jgi:hypothetical protein
MNQEGTETVISGGFRAIQALRTGDWAVTVRWRLHAASLVETEGVAGLPRSVVESAAAKERREGVAEDHEVVAEQSPAG